MGWSLSSLRLSSLDFIFNLNNAEKLFICQSQISNLLINIHRLQSKAPTASKSARDFHKNLQSQLQPTILSLAQGAALMRLSIVKKWIIINPVCTQFQWIYFFAANPVLFPEKKLNWVNTMYYCFLCLFDQPNEFCVGCCSLKSFIHFYHNECEGVSGLNQ